MKKQVVVVHGGNAFESHEMYMDFLKNIEINIEWYVNDKNDWKPWLRKSLGDGYEVILPQLPNKINAQYEEWKILFEKFIPFVHDGVALVGHSLGASFLAKYLSENKFPIKIGGVFLVSGVFDTDTDGIGLATFALPEKLDLQTENIFLYHSKDDPVVPFSALENFAKAFPQAHTRIFEDRKHINQETFPELVQDIKNLK